MTTASSRGARAKRSGDSVESRLIAQHRIYELEGRAAIDKLNVPTRSIGSGDDFKIIRTGSSGADFSGTLAGGRAVCFELKSCAKRQASLPIIPPKGKRPPGPHIGSHQLNHLDRHARLGALAFVLWKNGDEWGVWQAQGTPRQASVMPWSAFTVIGGPDWLGVSE